MKVLIRKDKKQQHRAEGKQGEELNSLQKELLVLGLEGGFISNKMDQGRLRLGKILGPIFHLT